MHTKQGAEAQAFIRGMKDYDRISRSNCLSIVTSVVGGSGTCDADDVVAVPILHARNASSAELPLHTIVKPGIHRG